MNHFACTLCVVGLAFSLAGCNGFDLSVLPSGTSDGRDTGTGSGADNGTAGSTSDSTSSTDSTGGIHFVRNAASTAVPEFGVSVTVSLVSRSTIAASVVVRYLVNDVEVRRTELLVPAGQTMSAIGPDLTTRVTITGTHANGDALEPADWVAGVDFDEGQTKQYVINDPADACPDDSTKTQPGVCDCGVPDVDANDNGIIDCLESPPASDVDGDETPDANDNCPTTPNADQADADSDGTGDACSTDSTKTQPGVCDCGVPDVDANDNGIIDCLESPPASDVDGDETPDANDNCPTTPNADQADTDGDGMGDACDACSTDSTKTQPGVCDCGVPDVDANDNGIIDCLESPPASDVDGDETPDANDNCPTTPNADQADADSDGTGDACDACSTDSTKTQPGVCDCGVPDVDANDNGIIDCLESPPASDVDGDETPDANDNCPTTPNSDQADCDQDGVGDACTISDCPPGVVSCGDCNVNHVPDSCDIASGFSFDINKNGVPDECEVIAPKRRYVDARVVGGDGKTWLTAYANPQYALSESYTYPGTVDEIWVAAGTYTPDIGIGDRAMSFVLVDGTSMYGGFAGNEASLADRKLPVSSTVLSGDLAGNDGGDIVSSNRSRQDNSFHVIRADMITPLSVLDGFTITGGNANFDHYTQGGGLYVTDSSLHMTNCAVVANTAVDGAGLYGAAYTLLEAVGCTFENNVADNRGGGINFESSGGSIAHCLFDGNQALYGGGLHSEYGISSTEIYGCRFYGNHAIQPTTDSQCGDGGGVWSSDSTVLCTNSVFVGNVADRMGGAIFNWTYVTAQVTNSTITANSSPSGTAIWSYSSEGASTTIQNSIVWEESQAVIVGPAAIWFSCVSQGEGTAVINADPQFVRNPVPTQDDYGDLRLSTGSPCIDAGDNYFAPVLYDIDGMPRFVDDPQVTDTGSGTAPIVDMGAYERHLAP